MTNVSWSFDCILSHSNSRWLRFLFFIFYYRLGFSFSYFYYFYYFYWMLDSSNYSNSDGWAKRGIVFDRLWALETLLDKLIWVFCWTSMLSIIFVSSFRICSTLKYISSSSALLISWTALLNGSMMLWELLCIWGWLWGRIAEISMFLVRRICLSFLIYICKSRFFFSSLSMSKVFLLHFWQGLSSIVIYCLVSWFFRLLCRDVLLFLFIVNYKKCPSAAFFCRDWCLLCS